MMSTLVWALVVKLAMAGLLQALVFLAKSARPRYWFRAALMLLLAFGGLAALAVPVYYASVSWRATRALTEGEFVVTGIAAVCVPIAVAWLGWLARQNPQVKGWPSRVATRNQHRTIRVRRLIADPRFDCLTLTHRTYMEGVRYLLAQINEHVPMFPLDLCVGINDGGTALAALLAASRDPAASIPVVHVQCAGKDHKVVDTRCQWREIPARGGPLHVLVVDIELKSGMALKNVVTWVQERYGCTDRPVVVCTAVLVAADVAQPIRRIAELRTDYDGQVDPVAPLPDFLAYTTPQRARLSLAGHR